jgi:hypothetical protein
MLFQAPQPSQRPVHFPWTEPHCWQTKRACDRGIRSTAVSVGHAARTCILIGPSARPWMNWST